MRGIGRRASVPGSFLPALVDGLARLVQFVVADDEFIEFDEEIVRLVLGVLVVLIIVTKKKLNPPIGIIYTWLRRVLPPCKARPAPSLTNLARFRRFDAGNRFRHSIGGLAGRARATVPLLASVRRVVLGQARLMVDGLVPV